MALHVTGDTISELDSFTKTKQKKHQRYSYVKQTENIQCQIDKLKKK
jgi:hypothetical protein